MPAPNAITPDKLFRLLGTPQAPTIIDVQAPGEAYAGFLPASLPRRPEQVENWSATIDAQRSVVVVCDNGRALSHGVAALLRSNQIKAEVLDGGSRSWIEAGLPLIRSNRLPPRNSKGQTVWVTRVRPKVDRIACPWLIRRFIDPTAQFLFVPPSDVAEVAERLGGEAFDIEGTDVFWSHRGELCTFDVMIDEFGLGGITALSRLAVIVRGADTARPGLAPEAAGLVAASLGLSRMFADDLAQLDAGMLLYDAFYRWARDAAGETHTWSSHSPKAVRS